MKSVAQQPRSSKARPARGSGTPLQAKARRGAGNRQRADLLQRAAGSGSEVQRLHGTFAGRFSPYVKDRLEQEAEDAAQSVMRGETGLARQLSRTRPAAFQIPGSRGVPLPSPALRELELTFGANLSEVRLHRGPIAFQATDDLGALAFAAGRDIYFSRVAPEISSESGRRLLAHEVAHTIQQTGRMAAGNRIAVVNTRGSRQPQLVYKSPIESTPVADRPTFDGLVQIYLGAFGNKQRTATAIKKIDKDHGKAVAAKDEASFWTELEKKAKDDKEFDESELAVRSFVYDALKLGGKLDGAVHLLTQDINLRSTFFLKEVYEKMPDRGYPWLLQLWTSSSFFLDRSDKNNPRDFSLKRFFESFNTFLLGATRDVPDLSTSEPTFKKVADEELKKCEKPSGLMGSEFFFVTLWTVREVDDIRQRKLGELAAKIAPDLVVMKKGNFSQWLSPARRKKVATALSQWAETLGTASPGLTQSAAEVQAFYREFAKPLQELADTAVKFWERIELVHTALLTGGKFTGAGDAVSVMRKVAERGEFQKFRKALGTAAEKQFQIKKVKLAPGDEAEQAIFPSPAEYEKARDSFIKTVRSELWLRFESALFIELRKPEAPAGKAPTPKQMNFLLVTAYGWMAIAIYRLVEVLGKYDRKMDETFASNPVTQGRADLRLAHRHELARSIWELADIFGWEELQSLAASVVTSQQAGQKKSQLALLSNWEENDVSIAKLTKDFAGASLIRGWEPLTFGDLATFFQTQQMRDITAEITSLMALPNAFDPQQKALVPRAVRAVDERATKGKLYPRRFSIENYVDAIRPEDRAGGLFAELIFAHPKTVALEAKEKPAGGESVGPQKREQGVFMWIIPPILQLIKLLHGFDEFHALIYRHWFSKPHTTSADLQPIRELEPAEWLKELTAAAQALGKTAIDAARLKFAERLTTDFKTARHALENKMREASILERTMRIEKILRPALEEYERYNQFTPSKTMGGSIYEIPGKVLSYMGDVARVMGPVEEQNLHYAALFLELAALMKKKLGENPRLDVANEYFAGITLVQKELAANKGAVLALMPGRDMAWIDTQAQTIEALRQIFEQKLVVTQESFGLIGRRDGTTQFVTGIGEGDVIHGEKDGKRDPFEIDGIMWAIVTVNRNFQFHPKYGNLPAILYLEDKVVPAAERTESLVLLTVNINGKNFPITAAKKDEDLLAKLSYAVTMQLIIRQLNELAAMMEAFAELALDVAEFVPGAGQIVMATRLAIAILTFVASGEAQQFVDALSKDPLGEIKRVLDLLSSLFSPDDLWTFALMGNNKFDQLRSKPKPKNVAAKPPKTTLQRFFRLMARVWNIGSGMLGAVGRMQSHVRWEVEAAQMSVLRHPLLAGALRWVSNHLEQIAQVTLTAIAIGEKLMDKKDVGNPEETELDLKQQFDKAVAELPDRINHVALQLGELQVPEKIVPLGELVEVIIQIVLSRLGAKYRVAGKIILKILEISGKKRAVFDAIASLIPDDADPNTYWLEKVVEPITPMLNTAKDELIDSIYDQLLKFEHFKAKKDVLDAGRSAAKSHKVATQEADLPETPSEEVQPHGVARQPQGLSRPGHLPASGPPMDPVIRRGAERRFGHDFRHVRLSTGSAGGFARRFGADAVTSGSQVFIRPGLLPSTGPGARILDHELTHVLQQTGPRPLGRSHSNRPVAGTAGRGLVVDPRSERAADRVANTVRSARRQGPVSVAPGGGGWQPALPYNVIRGLLDDLTSTGDIEQDEAKIDATGQGTGVKRVPDRQKNRIENFAQNLKETINGMKDFAAPFNDTDIPAAIKDQLLTASSGGVGNFAAIENAVADLAADSLRERKAKAGEVKDDEPQVVVHIDAQRFAHALGRYIFGRTGILMKIEVQPADKKDESTPITVSSLKVVYVHLPPVRGNHRLWTRAVEGLKGKNKDETDLLADKDKLLRRLRLYLQSKGPAPGIWKPKKYGLQQRVLPELVEFAKAMAAGEADLLPGDLTSKKDYLDPKGAPGPVGHIGLRIGTYKGSKNQQGRDRESHHTTQFLLLEYFAHKNESQKSTDNRPFPLIANQPDIYPGLEATKSDPTKFTGPTTMDLAGLVKGRGDLMPAILLARPTHRTGNLHVTTKADDFGDNPTDSPAGAVAFVFHENLGGDAGDYRKAEKGGITAFQRYKDSRGDNEVKKTIYVAMQDTYKWMRDFMRERLDNALPGIEMKYYNQLAEDGGKKDRLTITEMNFVATAAKENNKAEMTRWGWVG
jgi:hypothetical protein